MVGSICDAYYTNCELLLKFNRKCSFLSDNLSSLKSLHAQYVYTMYMYMYLSKYGACELLGSVCLSV